MPPTFVYLTAFGGWVCLALLVWLASACLLILPTTRRVAGPLASAMACTFPAVIAFQLAALPVLAVVLGVGLLVLQVINPSHALASDSPAITGAWLAVALAWFLIFGGASLLGFCEGWRAGWLVARGRSLGGVIAEGPSARIFRALRRRR